jgi:hypothetical protein
MISDADAVEIEGRLCTLLWMAGLRNQMPSTFLVEFVGCEISVDEMRRLAAALEIVPSRAVGRPDSHGVRRS